MQQDVTSCCSSSFNSTYCQPSTAHARGRSPSNSAWQLCTARSLCMRGLQVIGNAVCMMILGLNPLPASDVDCSTYMPSVIGLPGLHDAAEACATSCMPFAGHFSEADWASGTQQLLKQGLQLCQAVQAQHSTFVACFAAQPPPHATQSRR